MPNTSLGLTFPENETYITMGYSVFFTGESFNEVYGPGHVYSAILGILTVIVSMVGLVGNCLILKVFHMKKEETSFKTLVVGLAYVDIACIVGSMVIPIRDLGVPFGWLTHESFSLIMFIHFGYMLYTIPRLICIHITALIGTGRYLALKHPLLYKRLFPPECARRQLLVIVVTTVTLFLPFIFGVYPKQIFSCNERKPFRDMEQTLDCTDVYTLDKTVIGNWFEAKFGLALEFLFLVVVATNQVPYPFTAIITVLTYAQVLRIQNGRRASSLSNQERLPLQPAMMFLPSIVLMLLSTMFLAEGIHIEATGIRYVEIWMTCAMFTALNSSMNFVFFYWNSTDFQTQVDILVEKYKYKTKQRSNHVEKGV